MTHWILFAAPLIIASLVLVLGFVGCFIDSTGLGSATPYQHAINTHPNCISHWSLGETSGTTAVDSKDGNDGTYTGGVTLGQPGLTAEDNTTAVLFDGSSGYVSVPFNANLNPPSFTVAALVKIPSGSGGDFHAVVSCRDIGPEGEPFGYILYAGPTGVPEEPDVWQAWVGTGEVGPWAVVQGPMVGAIGMHFVAMTYDQTTLNLYVNPVELTEPVSLDTTFAPNTSKELRIGAGRNETATEPPLYFWPGVIDEVAIYDAALDLATLQKHFARATTVVDV